MLPALMMTLALCAPGANANLEDEDDGSGGILGADIPSPSGLEADVLPVAARDPEGRDALATAAVVVPWVLTSAVVMGATGGLCAAGCAGCGLAAGGIGGGGGGPEQNQMVAVAYAAGPLSLLGLTLGVAGLPLAAPILALPGYLLLSHSRARALIRWMAVAGSSTLMVIPGAVAGVALVFGGGTIAAVILGTGLGRGATSGVDGTQAAMLAAVALWLGLGVWMVGTAQLGVPLLVLGLLTALDPLVPITAD